MESHDFLLTLNTTKMIDKIKISNVISLLRFPLIVGVVIIHSAIITPIAASESGLNFVAFVMELCSYNAPSPCVPIFFIISGYLLLGI